MKIAIVTPVYPPYRGGMGAVAARDACELKARGFEILILTPAYPNRVRNPEAEYVQALGTFGNAALLPRLIGKLASTDLAHLHYPFYGADIFVWLWSVLWRKPYVMTYHMQAHSKDWREAVFRLHRFCIEPLILRRAQAIFVSSFDYALSIGLRHKMLVELPFGVDTDRFSPGRDDDFRAKLGISSTTQVFIFVGGLDSAHSFKGVDILLRAAACLSLDDDWRVLIVGDGNLRQLYQAMAKDLGLAARVVFAGTVSDDDLPRVYKACDVHVLPSISQSEAYGLVTLEAAATGLPSLVSNLPGVRTLVANNESGQLVEPGSVESLSKAMTAYLREPRLATGAGVKARERVLAHYTIARLADRLAEVYNRITA